MEPLFFFAVVLFICLVKCFFVGTDLWSWITPHSTLSVSDVELEKKYNNYYEHRINSQECYSSPGYTESDLFGDECKFIFFGEVLQCSNYVFDEEKVTYSCHIVKIRVEKEIYGRLKEGQVINLLCRWRYEVYEDDLNSIQKGREGIFITNGLPIRIFLNQSDECMVALGSLRHNKRFHYCLTSYISGLEKLETKQDVIMFWKKEGWLFNED